MTYSSADTTFRSAAEGPAARPRQVAVIGGGAAATAFLCALVKRLSAEPAADVPEVLVLEPSARCGPGVAYGSDTELALLNRPASAMSVDYADRGHFRRWLAHREPRRSGRNRSVFVPRSAFGRYLADAFSTACQDLRNLGGEVLVVQEWVRRVEPVDGGLRVHAGGSSWSVSDVVLCLGSVPARDLYRLSDAPGYVHQPYPMESLADTVPAGADVLVLGAGLTAVDVALTLGHHETPVHVTLASRTGLVPDVRSDLSTDARAEDLVADVRARLESGDGLDLRGLFGMLDAELRRSGLSLRETVAPFLARQGGVDLLRGRLADPGPASQVQRCVVALTPWYSRLWRALDAGSRSEFTRRYGRLFNCLRSPMPPVNARRLLGLAEDRALEFRAGLVDVRRADGGFRADFADGSSRRYDRVVNALGRGIDVTAVPAGTLVGGLVQGGLAAPHPMGGLDVEPSTNEVLAMDGSRLTGLHVIGDLASGVHFHRSSMEYVATQAGTVAQHVAAHMTQRTGILV